MLAKGYTIGVEEMILKMRRVGIDPVEIKSFGQKGTLSFWARNMRQCRRIDPDCDIIYDVVLNVESKYIHLALQDMEENSGMGCPKVPDSNKQYMMIGKMQRGLEDLRRKMGGDTEVVHFPIFPGAQLMATNFESVPDCGTWSMKCLWSEQEGGNSNMVGEEEEEEDSVLYRDLVSGKNEFQSCSCF